VNHHVFRVAGVLVALAVAGCAPLSTRATVTDVAVERSRLIEAESLARFGEFIEVNGARFDELDLEVPQYQGIVSAERWGDEVAACVERFNDSVRVTQQDGGIGVSYFGVVGDSYDRIRWTIEGCTAQYGIVSEERPAPGPVEVAWLYDDTVSRLMPCLRGLGVSPPSPPAIDVFARSVAAGQPWNPVELAVAAGHHDRVIAVCPSSVSELERRMPSDTAGS